MSEKRSGSREPRWSQTQASEELEAYRCSGLSQRAWCEQRGVSLSRLRYWAQKLEAAADEPSRSPFPSMVAVRVRGATPVHASDTPIELEVDSRFILRIPPGFDRGTLSAVLSVLTGRMAC